MTARQNTQNPCPSNALADLNDNTIIIDEFTNSKNSHTSDRFGNKIKTIHHLSCELDQTINNIKNGERYIPNTGGTVTGTIKAKAPVVDKIPAVEKWKEGLGDKSIISSDQWAIFNGSDWPYLGGTSNITIASWWGVGFAPLYSLNNQPQNNTVSIDCRAGTVNARGGFFEDGIKLVKEGDVVKKTLTIESYNAFRLKNTAKNISAMVRFDGEGFWILFTDKNNSDGEFNHLRPFYINATTGHVNFQHGVSSGGVQVLRIGDYGIGSHGATFSDNNFDEMNVDQSGFYNLGKDSKGTFPQGFSEFCSMIHITRSDNKADKKGSQIIIDTHNNRIAYRTTHINGFKNWAEFITTENVANYISNKAIVLYPNGSESSPPLLTNNQRIVVQNPFSTMNVYIQVELFINNVWGKVGEVKGSIYTSVNAYVGVSASATSDNRIIIQSAANYLTEGSARDGNPFGTKPEAHVTSAAYRVRVIKLGE